MPKTWVGYEVLCIYHSSDMDGWCSAELVNAYCDAMHWGKIRFKGMNYEPDRMRAQDFTESMPSLKYVFVVDYSIDPEEIRHFLDIGIEVYWFDHHISAIEQYADILPELKKNPKFHCELSTKIAAAANTLNAIFRLSPAISRYLLGEYPNVINVVRLVSVWDTWETSSRAEWERAVGLNYGVFDRTEPPFGILHKLMLDSELMEQVIRDGKIAARAIRDINTRICEEDAGILRWHGTKFVVLNRKGNSSIFEGFRIPDCAEAAMLWSWSAKHGMYRVGLYSINELPDDIDMQSIAVLYGGGGHKGAAGFMCRELPFSLDDIKPLPK